MNQQPMMMLIRYFDGRSEQAILLSNRGKTMRVAMRDSDDSAEFRYHSGVWLSENDDPVHIEGVSPSVDATPSWVN